MRILGIDPGSRITGFGVIEVKQGRIQYVTSGCVRVSGSDFPLRLKEVFDGVRQISQHYQPDCMAIEKVFVHKNVDSALKLGQARGAAICAVLEQALQVYEYAPTEIKKSVVGKGRAAKNQVQHMVMVLLNLPGVPQEDAADALAVALCHAQIHSALQRLGKNRS